MFFLRTTRLKSLLFLEEIRFYFRIVLAVASPVEWGLASGATATPSPHKKAPHPPFFRKAQEKGKN